MQRRTGLSLVAVALVVSAFAYAGGDKKADKKCTASTQECLDKMAETLPNRGLVGVEGDWNDDAGTYSIKSFIAGSSAQAAGIQIGDEMIAVNGIKLADHEAGYKDQAHRTPGQIAQVTVRRGGVEKTIAVTLMKMSDDQIAAMIGEHMREHASVKPAKSAKNS
jgi:C-terminal processing protease CtpA/Prc